LINETAAQGALAYEYDPLTHLTTLTLSNGQYLNHLYYESGHPHQLNLDGLLVSDMERDDLHREVHRLKANSPAVLAMTRWTQKLAIRVDYSG
jgi:hypothetical protein